MAYPLFLVKLFARTGLARFLPAVQRLLGNGHAYLRYYGDRVLAAPHGELRTAAAFLELHGPDAIDLALPAPRFDLVPSASTKLPADRRGWPALRGLPELCEAVGQRLHHDHGLRLNPNEEVLITPGAAGALSTIFDAFLNPGSRVVLFDPCSPLYTLACRQRQARVRWISTWVENGRTRFRLDLLARAMRGARLIVINSPCNPTGGMIAAEDLEQIAWWASRCDVLIVSDEVFTRYRYDDRPAAIATLPRARQRTLTVGSVSKGYALTSARVGWLAGNKHLVRPCAMTAALQASIVPTICQQIALTALQMNEESFEPIRTNFESRRRYAYERLQGAGLKPVWPAGAFFFWAPVSPLKLGGRQFAEQLLHTQKVLVSPGDLFGPSGRNYIRISYAAEDGRLREGLSRLGEFVRGLGRQQTIQARAPARVAA